MSIIRGKWCHYCNGRGSTPLPRLYGRTGGDEVECPQCHWVGFVDVTSAQVRQAEIDSMKEKV